MTSTSTPNEWVELRLAQVATFSSGTTPSRVRQSDFFDDGTHAWVKTMDLNNSRIIATDESVTDKALAETSLKIYPPKTVLVAMYGGLRQIGRTGILSIPAAVNQAITAITTNERELNPEFLLHSLNYHVGYWKSVASSSRKDPNITSNDVRNFPLLLPPVTEQAAIVEAIADVDDLVIGFERVIRKKQAIRQGIMQQLLTGKTRLPGYDSMWSTRQLAELLQPRAERNASAENLTVLTCTKHAGFVRSLDYFKNQVFSRDLSGYRVIHRGDIAYPANHVEEGSIGVQDLEDRALVSPIYVVMESRSNVDSYFLQRLLKSDEYRQIFSRATNASVDRRGSLRWPEFSRIEVSIPGIAEQQEISRTLRDVELEISLLERRLQATRYIKNGIMQGLLSGRIRLPIEEATA